MRTQSNGPVLCRCEACGTEFMRTRTRSVGRRLFCSPRCYQTNKTRRPAVDRFWPKVNKTDGCWLWTGAIGESGYGRLYTRRGTLTGAHRFAWELHFGPIPAGMFVCHHCDTPACVRHDHLFLGTPLANVRDMISKGRESHAGATNPIRGDAHMWHRNVRRGTANNMSRLTDDMVRYIRSEVAAGRMQKDVAAEIGMSKMAISRVVRRESWAHID